MHIGFKGIGGAMAAVALIAAPTAASAANSAASLSIAKSPAVRAGAATTGKSRIAAGPTATLINVGILAALTAIVLVATTGGDDDNSDSN